MKRRALLTSMGVGMAGVAGCLGGNSKSGSKKSNEHAGKAIAVSTPTGKKANLQLTGISATGTAQVSKEYTFEITVKNTGEQPGVYRAPVKVKTGDAIKYNTEKQAMVYVKPGATKTAKITLPAFQSIGRSNIRFASAGNTWGVDIVGPDLPMGAPFKVDGFRMTYETVEFKDSVSYKLDGISSKQTYSPGQGNKFAVAVVKLTSIDGPSWLADSRSYKLILDDATKNAYTDAGYSKTSLSEGQTRRFQFPYAVPEDTSKSDLIFKYSGTREDKYARWSPGFTSRSSASASANPGSGSTAQG
ncbi:MAG: hypothetical protein ABEI77_10205 [Halorientalis sp.]